MIPDLTRALRPEWQPALGQRRHTGARAALDVDERRIAQPAVVLEQRGRLPEEPGGERRIEERDVEGTGLAGEKGERIAALDPGIAGTPFGEARAQLAHRLPVALDEGRVRGTARQRLEPERTAAGEQVEAACVDDARAEPVEQSLPHPVGGRPD